MTVRHRSALNDAEDRGRGTDAKRQREHGERCKRGLVICVVCVVWRFICGGYMPGGFSFALRRW